MGNKSPKRKGKIKVLRKKINKVQKEIGKSKWSLNKFLMMETRISYSKLNLLGDHFKKANAKFHTSMLNGFQKRVRHLSLKSTPGMQKKYV